MHMRLLWLSKSPTFSRADCRHKQTPGVHGLLQHAAHRVRAGRKQAIDLFARQQIGALDGHLGKRNMQVLAVVFQHSLAKELGLACGLVHGPARQIFILDQMHKVRLHLLHHVLRRIALLVFGNLTDGADIDVLRARRKAALHHGVEHALT